MRIYQYFQQGQAPIREKSHPDGLTSAKVIAGQKAYLLIGCEKAWPWLSAIEGLRGDIIHLCKSFREKQELFPQSQG